MPEGHIFLRMFLMLCYKEKLNNEQCYQLLPRKNWITLDVCLSVCLSLSLSLSVSLIYLSSRGQKWLSLGISESVSFDLCISPHSLSLSLSLFLSLSPHTHTHTHTHRHTRTLPLSFSIYLFLSIYIYIIYYIYIYIYIYTRKSSKRF